MTLDDHRKLNEIFHAEMLRSGERIISTGKRFVHYTSAEVALSILRRREVWMRNSSLMNDFSEVQHGLSCLEFVFSTQLKARYEKVFNHIEDGLGDELIEFYSGHVPQLKTATFLTCISEHENHEDLLGRLSMWRAYGGIAGVAIVLDGTFFQNSSNDYGIFTNPVNYLSREQFLEAFAAMLGRCEDNIDFLKSIGTDQIRYSVFEAFKQATLCTKHPGFHEEKEWRLIYNPHSNQPKMLTCDVETVRGTPQAVFKLPLKPELEGGMKGASLHDLIDRIIIGPCQYPVSIGEAFAIELHKAGIAEAANKVFMSEIPLRHI